MSFAAIQTDAAGRRIAGHDAHSGLNADVDVFTSGFNYSSEFVAKDRRRLNHAGVETLFPDFEVGAAGQRDCNFNEDITRADGRNVHRLDSEIFAAVENRSSHVSVVFALMGAHEFTTTTFKVSPAGCAANSRALAMSSNGNR